MTEPIFLSACWGKKTQRLPLWIMRQAGRYLPEYREVRQKIDFLTLCRTPKLAKEVTLQPLRRFALDAAIVFSDIMMPLEAMGIDLQFNPAPRIKSPIRTAAAVANLREPAAGDIAPYVMETIGLLRDELQVPLIGFAGAPLTLAAYLVEGGASKDFAQLRAFLYAQPQAAKELFAALARCMAAYLQAQVVAGAQAIQLFDSWAGVLNLAEYRRFALPAVQMIMHSLRDCKVPRIYFAQDAAALWPAIREVDAEVWGVDWRVDLSDVRRHLGPHRVVQGNLDPAVLLANPEVIADRAQEVVRQGLGGVHIFNLGHGILPQTPVEHVHALLAAVRASSTIATD